jgi:Transposase DDE domain
MSALPIVHDWRTTVAGLVPSLHAHQAHALADLSFAVAYAGRCQAGLVAPHVPTPAHPASSRRRFERLLANPRFHVRLAQRDLTSRLLSHWSGCTVLLILDETPRANDLRVMSVRLAHAHRALPLAWTCYRPTALPRPLPQLIRGLLRQVRSGLPQRCRVVLLADRGLAWPLLVDFCRESGWHYVLRLQGTTRVRFPDESERPVRELTPRVGSRWLGEAEVFKKAGWRGANVVATWEPGVKEPWLLVTDEPGSLRHRRVYAKRMWVEESFRDDKSAGFGWGWSRVGNPQHAARLLAVLALAMVLAMSLGSQAQKAGYRRRLDPRRGRRLSLVQMGLRWLRDALTHGLHTLLKLQRLYLYPK